MAIPAPCTDQSQVVCCEGWYDVVNSIVETAGEAVRACIVECPEFPYYVLHGEPQGGGDYLAGWLAGVEQVVDTFGGKLYIPRARLNVNIAVNQSGYPMPEMTGNGIEPVPSPAEHSHAAYFSYGVAEVAFRATMSSIVAGSLGGCSVASIGQLRPENPQFGNARWRYSLALDVDL